MCVKFKDAGFVNVSYCLANVSNELFYTIPECAELQLTIQRIERLVPGFREAVHMGSAQHTETLGTALEGAKTKVHCP